MSVLSRFRFVGDRGIEMLETTFRLRPYINIIKRIGYGKIILFLLLTQPTNGRHWSYYGWIARLIGLSSLTFAGILAARNYPLYVLIVSIGLIGLRWYQRSAELARRKQAGINVVTLTDLRKRIVRDLPCPVVERELITRDNVRLRYQTVGTGNDLIFLANGIGGTIYHFDPLLNQLAQRDLYNKFTVVSWDFRGLFQSGYPTHAAAMSVRDHAEDVMELCNALERTHIHTIVGWSTGVQIALELSCMYPERVGRMILLNGSYGRTLQYTFQPILRVPWLGDVIHDLINFVRLHMADYYKSMATFMVKHRKWLMRGMRPYGLLYNQVDCEKFLGFYCIDILNNSKNHTDSYFRALQFLDAHSAEHLLHEITTPTLIITGMLDYLTPAYLSFEMYRQMPNSTLICHNFCTHFALLEKPHVCR